MGAAENRWRHASHTRAAWLVDDLPWRARGCGNGWFRAQALLFGRCADPGEGSAAGHPVPLAGANFQTRTTARRRGVVASVAFPTAIGYRDDLGPPHSLSDAAFDALFTADKPIVFAFHGYPGLIQPLSPRRRGIDRLPEPGQRGAEVQAVIRCKLVKHKRYIAEHGEDMPEIQDWQWTVTTRPA